MDLNILLKRKQSFVNDLDKCKACPEKYNSKTLNTNADVNQTLTSTQRAVNAIKYNHGGRIVFGNEYVNSNLGKIEDIFRDPNRRRPLLPLKNKF